MDRVSIIGAESRRFVELLSSVDPEARCPTCPDWNAFDLFWHLTEVHYFWAGILSRRVLSEADLPAVEESKPNRPAAVADLSALREQATAALLRELAGRGDAELTAGVPVTPIAADVAAGAVDHAVDVMWGWMPGGAAFRADCNVELVASDTDARWLVEVGSWTVATGDAAPSAVRASSGEPTAVVTAPVEDLALWAWTRGGTVDISGEAASRAVLDALITQGMQ
jgi:hypothetical protein